MQIGKSITARVIPALIEGGTDMVSAARRMTRCWGGCTFSCPWILEIRPPVIVRRVVKVARVVQVSKWPERISLPVGWVVLNRVLIAYVKVSIRANGSIIGPCIKMARLRPARLRGSDTLGTLLRSVS